MSESKEVIKKDIVLIPMHNVNGLKRENNLGAKEAAKIFRGTKFRVLETHLDMWLNVEEFIKDSADITIEYIKGAFSFHDYYLSPYMT